jgi:hypothetical protein
MAIQPWYLYPLDAPGGGYGEGIDPVCGGGAYCNYKKPDTNIGIPPGIAITALDSGVVTDVSRRGTGDGGLSVTIKAEHPINNVANYISYNFLGSASVSPGQHINAGQQVGISGSPTGILFALGLGNSPSWGTGSFPQGSGDPRFDPRQLLNAVRAGKGLPMDTSGNTNNNNQQNNTNNAYANLPFGIGGAITALQQSLINFAEESAVFLIALVLIILGVMLLAGKEIAGVTKKGVETAAIA